MCRVSPFLFPAGRSGVMDYGVVVAWSDVE